MTRSSWSAFSLVDATPDPASAAQALLREFQEKFAVDEVPPVPVERIATSLLDLIIEEADDLRLLPGAPTGHGQLSGMIDPTNLTIWIDRQEAERNPRRRRFTIAHEIGHWRLHVPGSDGAIVFDRPEDISDVDADTAALPALRRREAEANAFAQELLLPEPLVRDQAKKTGCNLSALAERFDVSAPAIRLRLLTLGLLPAWMCKQ